MKLNWKFQRGGRVQTKKNLPWGRYHYGYFLEPNNHRPCWHVQLEWNTDFFAPPREIKNSSRNCGVPEIEGKNVEVD